MMLFQATYKASRSARAMFVGVLMLCVSALSIAQNTNSSAEYSAGMNAYINGQYEEARQYWLSAADSGDAKAMFNLGLLHERSQISNADNTQAEQWFEKAGNAGYTAADYHLALNLQSQGKHAKATRLLERAANSGYVLAQEAVSSNFESDSLNTAQEYKPRVVNQNVAAASAGSNTSSTSVANKSSVETVSDKTDANRETNSSSVQAVSNEKRYNRESWLLGQSSDFWTIQMLAFSDESKVQGFIDQHSLHQNAAYFVESKDGASVYKLVYGAYISKERADRARSALSPALKKHGPWLRELNAVQTIIRQQK